jgi:hypothetical protein
VTFVLQNKPNDTTLVEPAEAIGFVMSQKMLRAIKGRAERATTQRHPDLRAAAA